MILRLRAAVMFVGILFASLAFGHEPQLSGIGILLGKDSAVIAVQAHLNKVSSPNELSQRLALTINGEPFVDLSPTITADKVNGVLYWRGSYRGVVKDFSVARRLFPEDSGSRTIVSVSRDGKEVSETILDAAHPSMSSSKPEQTMGVGKVISQFVQLGIMHIFTGPDHILFILGLILLGGSLKSLLKTVTAFTVAHSITLSIAATGLWAPPSRFVEPLIALSIVAVAFENLRRKRGVKDWRPLIAFAFGLIHGFGFAGGLVEAGLPHGAVGWALASFNVGVECAQASIVLSVAPLLAVLARVKPIASYRFVTTGSVAIALAGAVWFVERVRVI